MSEILTHTKIVFNIPVNAIFYKWESEEKFVHFCCKIYFLFSFFSLVCFEFSWLSSILFFSLIWKNWHKLLFFLHAFSQFHNWVKLTILKTLWTLLQEVVEKSSKNICWLYLKTQPNFPLPMLALSITTSKCLCLRQWGWESVPYIMTKHRAFHQLGQLQFILPLSIWIKFLKIILGWCKSVNLLEGISFALQPSSKHLLWLTCICWFNLLLLMILSFV